MGEGHPVRLGDGGIVGNLANSQLSPAVIPEMKAVWDLCIFVEFLA